MEQNPLRPSVGQSGKQISVAINMFPIQQITATRAFQYDVTFEPEVSPSVSRGCWSQVEAKVRELKPEYKKALIAYDGRRNAFSSVEFIPNLGATVKFDVSLDKSDLESEKGRFKSDVLSVTIKKVAVILFDDLFKYISGKGKETDQYLHAMTCLSTVLNHVPAMSYVPVGSNFFTSSDKSSLNGGLEVWRGYHQSIRALMAGHLGINLDVASTVFRRGDIPLLEFSCEAMGCRHINELERRPRLFSRLHSELKGIHVVTKHRGDMKIRFRIASVSQVPASEVTFEKDGRQISIVDYMRQEYNFIVKYPWLPVAFKSNGRTGFPLEVLQIAPSQRFMKKLSGQQVADMIKATIQRPNDRRKKIENAVSNVLKYSTNPYLESFGLTVKQEMMQIPARLLRAPNIVFADQRTASGNTGVWNLRGVRLCSTPPLSSFAFVYFVRIGRRDAEDIQSSLLEKWSRAGMDIRTKNAPVIIADPSQSGGVMRALQDAFSDASRSCGSRCQLLVCIIEKEPKSLYEEIKRITLTEAGVLSQCIQFRNVQRANAIKDQYAANVAMKVNIKLGGATNFVDNLPFFDQPTLLVGADVTHANPGSNAPSIAAIVTSMDRNATRYNTFLRAQGARVEIIEDMESVIGTALDRFKEAVSIYPENIIFFRDGVASSQFNEVRNHEIQAIKRALKARGIHEKTKLLFLVVQKRHHLRLFPNDRSNEDRSGNCVPGTVVDTHVVHPYEYNFILLSHSGIQGTSRPTIYHVIYDEIKASPDILQQFCFNLCFLSERATRSISIVAPSYRAHLAAFYGRMFIDSEGSETGSVRMGEREAPIRLKNVTEAISRTMYYM